MPFAFHNIVCNGFCFLERVSIGHAFKIRRNIPNCLLITFLWEAYFTDENVQTFEIWLSCLPSSLGYSKCKPKEKKPTSKHNNNCLISIARNLFKCQKLKKKKKESGEQKRRALISVSCALLCSPSAVLHFTSPMAPRKAAVTVVWETTSRWVVEPWSHTLSLWFSRRTNSTIRLHRTRGLKLMATLTPTRVSHCQCSVYLSCFGNSGYFLVPPFELCNGRGVFKQMHEYLVVLALNDW